MQFLSKSEVILAMHNMTQYLITVYIVTLHREKFNIVVHINVNAISNIITSI
jgi:hypothetical protein